MVSNIEPMVVLAGRLEAYHTEDLAEVTASGSTALSPLQETVLEVRALAMRRLDSQAIK